MLKEIIESFIMARKFENKMASINKILNKPKTKTYKVRLTEAQFELLYMCNLINVKENLQNNVHWNNFLEKENYYDKSSKSTN